MNAWSRNKTVALLSERELLESGGLSLVGHGEMRCSVRGREVDDGCAARYGSWERGGLLLSEEWNALLSVKER